MVKPRSGSLPRQCSLIALSSSITGAGTSVSRRIWKVWSRSTRDTAPRSFFMPAPWMSILSQRMIASSPRYIERMPRAS